MAWAGNVEAGGAWVGDIETKRRERERERERGME